MRYATLLLIAPAMLATGCSIFIAKAGKDLPHFRNRDDAHTKFGPPTAEGVVDGKPFEDFQSRGKIAEKFRAGTHSMALGMTMGLNEFYMFPRELYFLAKCGLVGQTVRVTYNPDGSVYRVDIDGRWYGGWVHQPENKINDLATPAPPPDMLTPTVQKLLENR